MKEQTIFPREEKAEVLFQKILNDHWACEKLQETFCNCLFCNDDSDAGISPAEFSLALFNAYTNRDLSAFLMGYRFDADGKQNPVIMTDENGQLLPAYKGTDHEKEYRHFHEVYKDLGNQKNIYFAQAYRYSHEYQSDYMDVKQKILEKNMGVLLIRELPDTVKEKETEAEVYSAVWDLMIELEKNLPMAYVFYGQDSLVENNNRYDEIGIFLPNSIFLKNLERHVAKAEEIIYGEK